MIPLLILRRWSLSSRWFFIFWLLKIFYLYLVSCRFATMILILYGFLFVVSCISWICTVFSFYVLQGGYFFKNYFCPIIFFPLRVQVHVHYRFPLSFLFLPVFSTSFSLSLSVFSSGLFFRSLIFSFSISNLQLSHHWVLNYSLFSLKFLMEFYIVLDSELKFFIIYFLEHTNPSYLKVIDNSGIWISCCLCFYLIFLSFIFTSLQFAFNYLLNARLHVWKHTEIILTSGLVSIFLFFPWPILRLGKDHHNPVRQ